MNVGLGVDRGAVLGLAGANGAGKTTLLDILTGRLRPEEGSIHLDGRDVTRLPTFRRARLGIARTFQSPVVPTGMTVGQTLHAAAHAHLPGVSAERIEEVRRFVELGMRDDQISGELETLARRKLLLTALLLREPSVLLLDEPASGLLANEIDALAQLILNIVRQRNIAVIIVEHRLELLRQLAQRVVILDLGSVLFEGPPDDAFRDSAVRKALLGADA